MNWIQKKWIVAKTVRSRSRRTLNIWRISLLKKKEGLICLLLQFMQLCQEDSKIKTHLINNNAQTINKTNLGEFIKTTHSKKIQAKMISYYKRRNKKIHKSNKRWQCPGHLSKFNRKSLNAVKKVLRSKVKDGPQDYLSLLSMRHYM